MVTVLIREFEWTVQQVDVKAAFLQSHLNSPVNVQMVSGTKNYEKAGQTMVG